MNNNLILGIYKEVGKKPELKKIPNTFKNFEKLLGGNFESIQYQDFIILYRKNNYNLTPNILINNDSSKLGITIRGNIFVLSKDKNGKFKSLNDNQLLYCQKILIEKSFNYKNQTYSKSNFSKNTQITNANPKLNNQEETLYMILGILAIILKYIKNNT